MQFRTRHANDNLRPGLAPLVLILGEVGEGGRVTLYETPRELPPAEEPPE